MIMVIMIIYFRFYYYYDSYYTRYKLVYFVECCDVRFSCHCTVDSNIRLHQVVEMASLMKWKNEV